MRNLAELALALVVAGFPHDRQPGDPVLPNMMASVTEDARSLGYDTFDAEGRLISRVTFTAVPGSNHGRLSDEHVWEARRVTFSPEDNGVVEEATSLNCPGLAPVLERMARLDPGRFNVLGVTPPPATLGPQVRDGYTYRFHGWALDPQDVRTRLSVEGAAGAVRELGRFADFQLEGCWAAAPRFLR